MRNCIFGEHLNYGDIFIEKIPEGVKYCLDCAEKYMDNTKYEGKEDGWVIGKHGVGYLKDKNKN